MKKLLNKFYCETKLGFTLLQPLFNIIEYFRYGLISDEKKLRSEFILNLGYDPDFENPKTLSEKIQWLKLNDRTSLHTQCADKYAVRDYVTQVIGEKYLVPLVFQSKNIRDINPKNIPDYPVIVKTNHDSSGGQIIRNKAEVDWLILQNRLGKYLNINYYYRFKEWQYKNVEKRVLVEKLLLDKNGNIPNDYKMYFINGKLLFTLVDIDRFTNHRRNLYDTNWELMEVRLKRENGRAIEKPEAFDEMKRLGEKLAKPFSFIRVDFYFFNDTIFFGEMTFHPNSGICKFIPYKYDAIFGEKLHLHKTKV